MVLPRVRHRDRHLDVVGGRRLETEMADDALPAMGLMLHRDQPLAVHVVGPAEGLGGAVLDTARPAMEACVERVP